MAATYGQLSKTFSAPYYGQYKKITPAQKMAYQKRFAAAYPTPTKKGPTVYRAPQRVSRYAGMTSVPLSQKPSAYTTITQRAAPDYSGIISGFQIAGARARAANIARQRRIESIYDEMMRRFQPGGAFERRGLGEIERARTRGVGQEMQQMISSGMYGTTTAAGIPRQWEAEVGAPARLRLEDIMQQRLTGIQMQKAGFLERIQEPYPDYSMLMSAIMR